MVRQSELSDQDKVQFFRAIKALENKNYNEYFEAVSHLVAVIKTVKPAMTNSASIVIDDIINEEHFKDAEGKKDRQIDNFLDDYEQRVIETLCLVLIWGTAKISKMMPDKDSNITTVNNLEDAPNHVEGKA